MIITNVIIIIVIIINWLLSTNARHKVICTKPLDQTAHSLDGQCTFGSPDGAAHQFYETIADEPLINKMQPKIKDMYIK